MYETNIQIVYIFSYLYTCMYYGLREIKNLEILKHVVMMSYPIWHI